MACFRLQFVALALGVALAAAAAQEPPRVDAPAPRFDALASAPDPERLRLWDPPLGLQELGNPSRTPRLDLLGLPTGFLREPVGVDDDPTATPTTPGGDESVLVSVGTYNPYIGWRRPSEPGGLGYAQFYSQVQLLDLGNTSVCLGLRTLMPAGLEQGGVRQGPSLVTPSFAWFHDLGEGVALHGFVGQDITPNSRLRDNLERGMCCG